MKDPIGFLARAGIFRFLRSETAGYRGWRRTAENL